MGGVPVCPREGHAGDGWRVVRDGVQRRGGRERQRYRCIDVTGDFHRFLGSTARTRATAAFCLECDNDVRPHEGPVTPWRFEYLVREVAEALVSLGRGMSYTEVAKRARMEANVGRFEPAGQVKNGQTVAEWVADFVPVVAAPFVETEWPDETLVLDSTEFMGTNPRTGTIKQLWSVLAAWGYPSEGPPRLWRLEAAPHDDGPAWDAFLAALPGAPASVVCDRDYAIIGAVQRRWGGKVPVHLSEHHMWSKGLAALRRDDASEYGSGLNDLLADALHSNVSWNLYRDVVNATAGLPNTKKWVAHWNKRMQAQTLRRDQLPAHYANGAIEASIATTRAVIGRRAWTLRNLPRMNLLLELVRLRINRHDDVRSYTTAIRNHVEAAAGDVPRTYRKIMDPKVWDPVDERWVRTSSLHA